MYEFANFVFFLCLITGALAGQNLEGSRPAATQVPTIPETIKVRVEGPCRLDKRSHERYGRAKPPLTRNACNTIFVSCELDCET